MSLSPRPAGAEDDWSRQVETPSASARPSKRRRTAATREAENQETGLMRDGDSPGLPRFVGSGSGIYFVRTVYDILARNSDQPSRRHSQLVPGEDDQLDGAPEASDAGPAQSPGTGARAPFWRDDEILSNEGSAASSVSFEAMIEWTKSYFEIWHPAFPFLHGPEALETLEKVSNRGIESVSGPDAAIVRAIVSISLADARQRSSSHASGTHGPPPVPSDLVFLNLDHVASSVPFVLGTPASLKNIQAALCVELFLVSMLKFNMASRLGGTVCRMAYHLGLHRCPQRYPNFSSNEVSMRKRIWWSFYCLERLVCQALGLPLDVQDDDVDVCLPTSEIHKKPKEDETPDQDAQIGSDQLQLLTLLSKHAQLRGMILELRHKSLHVRQDSTERALEVQSRLMGWANGIHDVLMRDQTDEEEDTEVEGGVPCVHDDGLISTRYKALLLILQHESTITLNRPLLAKKPMTSASRAGLEACIHASRAIIETVDDQQVLGQQQSTKIGTLGSSAVVVWPLLTWSVWMSSFVLAYAALEGVTTVSSAQRYTKRTLRVLKQLSKRGTAWPNSCAQAVEHLLAALDKRKLVSSDTDAVEGTGSTTSTRPLGSTGIQPSSGGNYASRRRTDRTASSTPQNAMPRQKANGRGSSKRPRSNQVQGAFAPPSTVAVQPTITPHHNQHAGEPLAPDPEGEPNMSFAPQDGEFLMDLNDQSWLLDPLGALDFSNFAQAGSSESAMGFTFY